VDLRLPGGSGLDLVRELKRLDATTNVVVLAGYGSIATALESVRVSFSLLSGPMMNTERTVAVSLAFGTADAAYQLRRTPARIRT